MSKIKSPAYKNMTKDQLEASTELGRKILDGEVDLVELDNRSLQLRVKRGGKGKVDGKRKREPETTSKENIVSIDRTVKRSKSSFPTAEPENKPPSTSDSVPDEKEDFTPWLKKIALSDKTHFQRNVLTALCQVPRGRYTSHFLVVIP